MGGHNGGYFELGAALGRGLRAALVAVATAALALVALPTGASADPRVPPSACPPDLTLQGIERAAGGVIFTGRVVATTPSIGWVAVAVESWYHRSAIAGLRVGEHPDRLNVALGPGLTRAGPVAPAAMPEVGSRWFVAGTWAGPGSGVSVRCGIVAGLGTRVGSTWLARADAHYMAMAPTSAGILPGVPLDAPWVILGLTALLLGLAAAVFGTIAEARDPLPVA
jgi:hypothetical protein